MKVVLFPEADTPPELRTQVLALHRRAWPTTSGSAHDPTLRPLSMLLVDDGRVVATLDILSKEISHCDRLFSASGLSAVATDEESRGRGHGRALVEAAYGVVEKSGVDLGIFTCDRPLLRLYERAGWQELPGAVLVGGTPEAPLPSDRLAKVVVARFFSAKAQRHRAAFVGSRIGLYPGNIDKLW
jgi:aminoglycoside 2'-N-acetyltransferase I